MIKKLVVITFELPEDRTITHKKGQKYSYFVDQETGKFYEPNAGFEVTGEDLEELFREVGTK